MRENAWGSVRPAFALKNSGREGGMGGRPLSPPPTRGISARKIFFSFGIGGRYARVLNSRQKVAYIKNFW